MFQTHGLRLGTLLALFSAYSLHASAITELKVCSGQAAFANVFNPINPTLEKEFQVKIVPGVDVNSAGSEETYKGLMNGTCEATVVPSDFQDWIQVLRESKITVAPEKFTYRVIGRDRIKLISNPTNKLEKLSKNQLADIFSGKVQNWKTVGGPDLPVKLALSKAKIATIKVIQRQVLKGGEFTSQAVNLDSWTALVDYVAKTPGAISFVSGNVESKGLVQLKTDGELGRPMTLITIGKPSDRMQKIIQLIHEKPELFAN